MRLTIKGGLHFFTLSKSIVDASGAARNFVREGPVTDVIRVESLAILHKDHFDAIQLNFWSITTGCGVKHLLLVSINKY